MDNNKNKLDLDVAYTFSVWQLTKEMDETGLAYPDVVYNMLNREGIDIKDKSVFISISDDGQKYFVAVVDDIVAEMAADRDF